MTSAPIVLFVYNRIDHIQRLYESLIKNEECSQSDLYIFSDGGKDSVDQKKVQLVRNFVKSIEGFRSLSIIERQSNHGLAKNVIDGVSEVIGQHGKVIVLEDDLIVSPYFLKYMNKCLSFYKHYKEIWSISGYSPPIESSKLHKGDVYYTFRGCSWGWGTWLDRWETVDWSMEYFGQIKKNKKWISRLNEGGNDLFFMLNDQKQGRINSWAIRWVTSGYIKQQMTVYPKDSLITNEGNDDSGTHSSSTTKFDVNLNNTKDNWDLNSKVIVDEISYNNAKNFYNLSLTGYIGVYSRKLGVYKYLKKIKKMF